MKVSMTDPVTVRYALFDFDGTISTLRQGWENVMQPLMLEMIAGSVNYSQRLRDMVSDYIDRSTGIQTIEQMIWLVETAKSTGLNPEPPEDPWQCKTIYIERLHDYIRERRSSLENKTDSPESYLIAGSRNWLQYLSGQDVKLYLASGTDEIDVRYEAKLLGVDHFFQDIAGARDYAATCAKETVIRTLLAENKVPPAELAVFGDGPVEISIGRQTGARTVGIASNEVMRSGMDARKRKRLEMAGADIIRGDFTPDSIRDLPAWLGLEK